MKTMTNGHFGTMKSRNCVLRHTSPYPLYLRGGIWYVCYHCGLTLLPAQDLQRVQPLFFHNRTNFSRNEHNRALLTRNMNKKTFFEKKKIIFAV